MYRIENVKIYEDLTEREVIEKISKKAGINKEDILESYIVKKAIDARKKEDVHYSYTVDFSLKNEKKYAHLKKIEKMEKYQINRKRKSEYRPIIVGTGPAGLFCALTLIENGYKPILLEQGGSVEERVEDVYLYRTTGVINTRSNVQFGEGGAGTFSDGKLTTSTHSPYIEKVLETFYTFGAPKEILYTSKPHIGTDNLLTILKNIRTYIEERGGTYHFHTKFETFTEKENILEIHTNKEDFITDALVLAIGHSARDTFLMLKEKNMKMQRKNFAVGVRIEHKQKMINEAQYGTKTHLSLPSAEYKLAYHGKERSCFTFCMCPGGEVIASASEQEAIVTNGMSYYKRDKENANSALLVNVLTTDFLGVDPLAGMYFQEELEHKAFVLGGSNYNAPIQRVEDFLNNQKTTFIGKVKPTYKPGVTYANLQEIFPNFLTETLKEGILYFGTKIKGFDDPDAILTGVETRSSSPVTLLREDSLESSIKGIYPCGEGAGYAGGITSAAVDGIKVAIKIIEKMD